MNPQPLQNDIVVKRIEGYESTFDGIPISDSAKEEVREGEVVEVGRGKRLEDGSLVGLDVRIGDRVLFRKHSGVEAMLAGAGYLILREADILGILSLAATPSPGVALKQS